MIKLYESGVYLINGEQICTDSADITPDQARKGTMTWKILQSHSSSADKSRLQIRFDSLTSHDITYVGIILTALASGMKQFNMPYVLTNCHNSLCAVGGTINEDDHKFALSAARKFGGIYVPANMANIHSYNREMMSGVGRMILGSDSHTRYGALGTMGIGEGGGELAKQLVNRSYDINYPEVIAVYLDNAPRKGIGPQDIALTIVGNVYKNGYVKNKVMEFVGPGIKNLPVEYRNAIDVMTTETACLSSIWVTDEKVSEYYELVGRPNDYAELHPQETAWYDGCIYIDMAQIESTIAMPMHPSNIYTIHQLQENPVEILTKVQQETNALITGASIDLVSKYHDGGIWVQQGEIAGCAGGTFDSLWATADILKGKSIGNGEFSLNIYPGSLPTLAQLVKTGRISDLISAGAMIRECFCGPCFGAGDCPANGEFSIRHTTRNFPNREGSKPSEQQMAAVALMDARSVAATAINHGRLTAATDIDVEYTEPVNFFDRSIYDSRVYDGWGRPDPDQPLVYGPNIKPWPDMPQLTEDLLLKICSYITDPVTTTDELIPSGETSSYRSNPERLSEFALYRRDPQYIPRTKAVREIERGRQKDGSLPQEVLKVYEILKENGINADPANTDIGSTIYANMPGDGSAREQAASSQRVMGASANIASSYATKRYRSNCINWGMIPFITRTPEDYHLDDYVFIPHIRDFVLNGGDSITAYIIGKNGDCRESTLSVGDLTDTERQILADGCLINYYRNGN